MSQGAAALRSARGTAPPPAANWTRPPEWLAMPSVVNGDQKVCGLHAVYQNIANWVTIQATGAYTIDWGDGTAVQNVATGIVTSKVLAWADYASSVLTADGARQAMITVTPQAGQNLATVSFNNKHATPGSAAYTSGWMDIAMAGQQISGIMLGGPSGFTHSRLQRFRMIGSHAITNMANNTNNFSSLANLRTIDIDMSTTAALATSGQTALFSNCVALVEVNFVSTALSTSCASMFNGCSSLTTLNGTLNLNACTTALSMFSGCSKLTSVTLSNTGSLTTCGSMFLNCTSLTSITMSLTACTTLTSIFSGCSRLSSVNLTNTGSVTDWTSAFNACVNLATISLTTTLAVNMTSMFSGCSLLSSVTLSSTANVTNMTTMFQNCISLTVGPTMTTTALVTASSMFNGCTALASIPTYSTAALVTITNMFVSCGALTAIPAMNWAAVTTGGTTALNFCTALASCVATGMRFAITLPNTNVMNAAALDAFYTALGTASGAQTVTVTGSAGIATDTPSIATSKGWSVVGS